MPRFRLQTLLVLVTAFAVALGLFVRELHREHRKEQVAAEVHRLGGHVRYKRTRPGEKKATGVVNGWLRVFLGNEYFAEASYIALRPRSADDLDLLLAFPEITRLKLIGSAGTDAALGRLIGLNQLESLDLHDAITSERGLKSLAELPNLRALALANCSLSDESLNSLTEIPNLRSLHFTKCSPSDESLKSLAKIPNLRSLSFRDCSLSDSSLRSLYGARSSVELGLFKTNVTEAGMLAIRDANPTWSVRFRDQSFVQPGAMVYENYLPSIQQLPQAKELAYQGSLTSGATLAILKNARSLNSLRLVRCRVTDDDLQYLRPLKNLTSLHIGQTAITDEGVRALQGLTKLQVLRLTSTKIEGLGLGSLPASITELDLSYSEVTDRGVANIAKQTSLEVLHLGRTRVTDEGIDDLAKMTSLRRLYLWGTAISDAGVARLQRALPSCKIQHTLGANKANAGQNVKSDIARVSH